MHCRKPAVAVADNRIGTDRLVERGDVDRGALICGVGKKRALSDIVIPDRVADIFAGNRLDGGGADGRRIFFDNGILDGALRRNFNRGGVDVIRSALELKFTRQLVVAIDCDNSFYARNHRRRFFDRASG